jgi:hypothetical protein
VVNGELEPGGLLEEDGAGARVVGVRALERSVGTRVGRQREWQRRERTSTTRNC